LQQLQEWESLFQNSYKKKWNYYFFLNFRQFTVGLSNGIIPAVHTWNIDSPEYYGFRTGNDYASHYDFCSVSGRDHAFEWPNGAIKPNLIWGPGVVIGCGILLNPDMKLAIFFTRDGTLMGQFLVWNYR
jgi:hypothetical protein